MLGMWLALILLMLSPIYVCFDDRSGDCALATYFPILYINLPFSFIGLILDLLIDYLISLINHTFYVSTYYDTYMHPILYWLMMLILGYIQWFIFTPWMWNKIKKLLKNDRS